MEQSAPTSQGSLIDTVCAAGQKRCTAWWIVSVPAVSERVAHGHVAGEFVMICSPVDRSNHALWSTPWWPGWVPVRIVVWLASVTEGSDAIAPWPITVPPSTSRARWGASPRATRS